MSETPPGTTTRDVRWPKSQHPIRRRMRSATSIKNWIEVPLALRSGARKRITLRSACGRKRSSRSLSREVAERTREESFAGSHGCTANRLSQDRRREPRIVFRRGRREEPRSAFHVVEGGSREPCSWRPPSKDCPLHPFSRSLFDDPDDGPDSCVRWNRSKAIDHSVSV